MAPPSFSIPQHAFLVVGYESVALSLIPKKEITLLVVTPIGCRRVFGGVLPFSTSPVLYYLLDREPSLSGASPSSNRLHSAAGGFFCSFILHSMVRCSVGRVCCDGHILSTPFLRPHWPSGGWSVGVSFFLGIGFALVNCWLGWT